jgi:DNA replication and repair protein RecF
MRFKRLIVKKVRNLADLDAQLNPGLNHFFGSNGAGKTAVLESIHLLCRGRSFRSPLLRDVITRGEDALLVRAEWHDEYLGDRSVGIQRSLSTGTEVRLDGRKVSKISDIARLTPLQTLLPDVSELVFGGPKLRRSWLDWGMFHVKPDYLAVLRDYLRVLKQRNAVLRSPNGSPTMLAPWDAELSSRAAEVTAFRREYLSMLNGHLNNILDSLVPELRVSFEYQQGWTAGQSLEKLLGQRGTGEVKYRVTQWGPHRADIRFKVSERDAAKVLSRGQGKLLATSMKVAQVALLNAEQSRASIFLIDDVGAELDLEHSDRFFRLLREQGSQVISTSVQPMDRDYGFPVTEIDMFHVEHGAAKKQNSDV